MPALWIKIAALAIVSIGYALLLALIFGDRMPWKERLGPVAFWAGVAFIIGLGAIFISPVVLLGALGSMALLIGWAIYETIQEYRYRGQPAYFYYSSCCS